MQARYFVAFAVAALACVQGCEQSRPGHEAADDAVRVAEQAIEDGNYAVARYALLHAMIIDPGSSDLFQSTAQLAGELIETGGAEALDFAEDLLGRLDQMVPYQPLNRHEALGEELERLWRLAAEEPGNLSPFATLEHLLSLLDQSAPPELRMILVREAVAEFERTTVWRSGETAEFDSTWQNYADRLEEAEKGVLAEMFSTRQKMFEALQNDYDEVEVELAQTVELNDLDRWGDRNRRLNAILRELSRWEREFSGYLESDIPNAELAETQVRTVASAQAELLWAYSRGALDWISSIEELQFSAGPIWEEPTISKWPDDPPVDKQDLTTALREGWEDALRYIENNSEKHGARSMVKLLLLTLVDADRLIPYVRYQFDSVWQSNYEILSKDKDGAVAIAKLIVLREVQ